MVAIDLNDLKKKPQETSREPIEVETAFLVIIRPGGIIQASPDINAPVVPDRTATLDDMAAACHRVLDDVQATKTAQMVQVSMNQTAAAMQQQMQSAQIARELKL